MCNNGSEGSAGSAACKMGSAFAISRVSRSMLLITKGTCGSSIALMVAHTAFLPLYKVRNLIRSP